MNLFIKEAKNFYHLIFDQLILSLIFTAIIFLTPEDYNLDITEKDPLYRRILHCWHFAIVTQYTVGYGYVYPITTRGQILNTIHILISYYLLAKDLKKKLN